MEKGPVTQQDGIVETLKYDEMDDRLVVETSYDAEPAIEEADAIRQAGGVTLGAKNQQMVHVATVNMGDIVRLRALGYDLLSPDPAESHRALIYLRDHEQKFVTRGDAIADRKVIWQ